MGRVKRGKTGVERTDERRTVRRERGRRRKVRERVRKCLLVLCLGSVT